MIPQQIVVKDSDVVGFGGNKFGVIETPGHTLGPPPTLSTSRTVPTPTSPGGLGLNAVKDSKQVEDYIA